MLLPLPLQLLPPPTKMMTKLMMMMTKLMMMLTTIMLLIWTRRRGEGCCSEGVYSLSLASTHIPDKEIKNSGDVAKRHSNNSSSRSSFSYSHSLQLKLVYSNISQLV